MKSVFVVEDDSSIAAVLRDALEDFGLDIFASPADVPQGRAPALVITDLQSPEGYRSDEAIRIVQALRSRTGAPVMVLTAHGPARLDADLAAETVAVMLKPFDINELIATVERFAS
ncbi:MAG: response regulator [Chloroflexota bacterium]